MERKIFQKSGKFIIFANHVHALDSVALVLTSKRKIVMIAKEELFKKLEEIEKATEMFSKKQVFVKM